MRNRRTGFTLIELLVVIAIIGILAAMLFPVFARARESARKTQCLANVKNIALAINMYLADYDKFPPSDRDKGAQAFFASMPGAGGDPIGNCDYAEAGDDGALWAAKVGNPYLKWPVVLDDYCKNRDIWKCPSAKMESSAQFIYNDAGNWVGWLNAKAGSWGRGMAADGGDLGPNCSHAGYPSGWGGATTDSIAQASYASGDPQLTGTSVENRVFVQSIAAAQENLADLNLSSVQDAAKLIVAADSPPTGDWLSIARIAYSNVCCAECSGVIWTAFGGPECPSGAYCDAACFENHATLPWAKDVSLQKAGTRHLGGSNVGFGDGHAKWYAARAIVAASDEGGTEGVGYVCPTSKAVWDAWDCGTVPPELVFFHNSNMEWDGKLK